MGLLIHIKFHHLCFTGGASAPETLNLMNFGNILGSLV